MQVSFIVKYCCDNHCELTIPETLVDNLLLAEQGKRSWEGGWLVGD